MAFQTAIDHDKYHKFFDNFLQKSEISKTDCQLVAVLHVLPDVVPFYRAMEKVFDVRFVIPKPRSINDDVYKSLPRELFIHVKQGELRDYGKAKERIFSWCDHNNCKKIL